MARIRILVGSVGGRALQTATAVAHVLNRQGHQIRLNMEPDIDDLQQDEQEVLLVCCSTTGQGELPGELLPLFHSLDDERIDLQQRCYGVIALGNSGYPYFARAGYLMEDALYRSGAHRIGDICTLDARHIDNHPLSAAMWANDWVAQLP